jgi:2-dehydro-3-deoxyphosphooctonate aldolase (KDO 8-P synthase)
VAAVTVGSDVRIGGGAPLALLAGPCSIESEQLTVDIGHEVKAMCARLGIPYVFKASYDKANRSSADSFRGPGMAAGLRVLARVRDEVGVPVVTDVHQPDQCAPVAEVVDLLQIPAFLCRQTDLLVAAAATGRPVSVKKGQWVSPQEMANAVDKLTRAGAAGVLLTERGSSFGYNNLVVDFRGLEIMRRTGCPIVFDATHSVQMPGGLGNRSGGQREFVPVLARAAVAVGVDALFMEVHPDPDNALSDGPNMVPLSQLEQLLTELLALHAARPADPVQLAPYA